MLYFIPDDVNVLLNGRIIKRNKCSDGEIIKPFEKKEEKEEKEKKVIEEKKEKKIHKKSKKRCNLVGCKKKLKLTDLKCNCDLRFCSKHRLPELHFCTQNLKEKNRQKYLKRVQLGGGEVIQLNKI